MLRGRLRESVQLGARHGLPLPLEIRHDEFTVDIPENQILRTACARMLAVPRVDDESARMLRRLLREFGDVSELPRGDPVPSWTPTRLNVRYHHALRLASLVLAGTAVEHGAGNVAVNGFLIDMPTLFEKFVRVALREALVAGTSRGQSPQPQPCRSAPRDDGQRPSVPGKRPRAVSNGKQLDFRSRSSKSRPSQDLLHSCGGAIEVAIPILKFRSRTWTAQNNQRDCETATLHRVIRAE